MKALKAPKAMKAPDLSALDARRAELEQRRAELLDRLGEAVNAGRTKEEAELRTALDDVDRELGEIAREKVVAIAVERAAKERAREAAFRPLLAEQAALRERWAEVGRRLQAAADALEAAWTEHEACWHENQRIARELERIASEHGVPAPAPLSMSEVFSGVPRDRLLPALNSAAGQIRWDRQTPPDWPRCHPVEPARRMILKRNTKLVPAKDGGYVAVEEKPGESEGG